MSNIENAKYLAIQQFDADGETETVIAGISCTLNGDINVSVPLDSDNTDYVEILRQVAAGELTIAAAD